MSPPDFSPDGWSRKSITCGSIGPRLCRLVVGLLTPGLPQLDFQTPDLVADLAGGARGARRGGRSFGQGPELLVEGLLDRYEPGDLAVQCFGFGVIAYGIGTHISFAPSSHQRGAAAQARKVDLPSGFPRH